MAKRCARCDGTFRIETHHIVPRTQGGSDDATNLIELCAVCHGEIHTGVTQAAPTKHVGTDFEQWVEDYDGPPKEPWTMEFVCNHCHHRWVGKPVQERNATNICCPRERCPGSGHIVLTDTIIIDAYGLKQLLDAGDSINYVPLEIQMRKTDGLPWLQSTNESILLRMYDQETFFSQE